MFLSINNFPITTIIWNLLLLLIPYYSCKYLIKLYQKSNLKKLPYKLLAVSLGLIWLLFIPNSAYIMTDIRHILNFCPLTIHKICIENAWMTLFFFTYASIGWVTFVYLLNQMKIFINEIWGKLIARIYILAIIPTISLGVLLGLVNRWNSWEIFISTDKIFISGFMYLTNFTYFKNWLIFTMFLYLLYFAGNLIFKKEINKYK